MFPPNLYATLRKNIPMLFLHRFTIVYHIPRCRSAAAFLRARNPSHVISSSEFEEDSQLAKPDSLVETKERDHHKQRSLNFQFPFGDWSSHPWSKQQDNQQKLSSARDAKSTRQQRDQELQLSPFLPKITMVGISTGETGKMQKANIKKMMDDLTKELERVEQVNQGCNEATSDERDPLFVANVGDYYSSVSNTRSARWVRGGSL